MISIIAVGPVKAQFVENGIIDDSAVGFKLYSSSHKLPFSVI